MNRLLIIGASGHGKVTSAVTYLVYKRVGNVLRDIIAPQARVKTQSV